MANKLHKVTISLSDDALQRISRELMTKKVTGNLFGWLDGFCLYVLLSLKKGQKEISIPSGYEDFDKLLKAAE